MNREATLFGSARLEADSPGLRASLTYWFGLITLNGGSATAHLKGEWVELLALIRRILHVWHPALGNGMACYTAWVRRALHGLLMGGLARMHACA